jgi:hypothetical protein
MAASADCMRSCDISSKRMTVRGVRAVSKDTHTLFRR